MSSSPPPIAIRPRLAWSGAVALLALAAAAAAEARGRAARTAFQPPAGFGAGRWAEVADAAEAVRVWGAAGLKGRKLVVLTGRWAALQPTFFNAPPPASEAGDFLTPESAAFAAMREGIAREMTVAMPERAYRERLGEIRRARGKGVEVGDGWFRHRFHGFERRFCVPGALWPEPEPVLALVEPSFFDEENSTRVEALLRERGISLDLGLVAASDPAASPSQKARAQEFASAVAAVALGVAP